MKQKAFLGKTYLRFGAKLIFFLSNICKALCQTWSIFCLWRVESAFRSWESTSLLVVDNLQIMSKNDIVSNPHTHPPLRKFVTFQFSFLGPEFTVEYPTHAVHGKHTSSHTPTHHNFVFSSKIFVADKNVFIHLVWALKATFEVDEVSSLPSAVHWLRTHHAKSHFLFRKTQHLQLIDFP